MSHWKTTLKPTDTVRLLLINVVSILSDSFCDLLCFIISNGTIQINPQDNKVPSAIVHISSRASLTVSYDRLFNHSSVVGPPVCDAH